MGAKAGPNLAEAVRTGAERRWIPWAELLLSPRPLLHRFAKSHAHPSSILIDELDSGLPKSGFYFLSRVGSSPQKAIVRLKSFDRWDRDLGSHG
jgi:hypothetical protein